MRKLTLETFASEELAGIAQKDLILEILRTPSDPKGGVNYLEMARLLPIIQKVRESNGELVLEDAEWDELSSRAKQFPFKTVHEELFTFLQRIVEA